MTPADYPAGARVTFADPERDVHSETFGEAGLRRGVVNGDAFEHGDTVYVPVYVPAGDLCIVVNAANIAEVAR